MNGNLPITNATKNIRLSTRTRKGYIKDLATVSKQTQRFGKNPLRGASQKY